MSGNTQPRKIRHVLAGKQGFSHIQWTILIIILCIIMAFVLSYILSISTAAAQKGSAKHVLDQYIEQNAIDIYSQVKVNDDYTAGLLVSRYIDDLIQACGLEEVDGKLQLKAADGNVVYALTKPQMFFEEDYTPKVRVSYTMFVPLEFNGTKVVWVDIPISITSRFLPKFEK